MRTEKLTLVSLRRGLLEQRQKLMSSKEMGADTNVTRNDFYNSALSREKNFRAFFLVS